MLDQAAQRECGDVEDWVGWSPRELVLVSDLELLALPVAVGWNLMILGVLSNPSHPMIFKKE